jgi:hypothetical protein
VEHKSKSEKGRPAGSGYLALAAGIVFAAVFASSFVWDLKTFDPHTLFQIWLLFAATVLLSWGGMRIRTGKGGDWRVGQPTLNFVVGLIAVTIALLALTRG